MIPAEAVEAAAKALRTAPLHGVASWRDIAQTALEAAAPHMKSTTEGTTMTEHEELLKVLLDADEARKAEGAMWPQLVDAILAAGYRKTP